MATQAQVKAFIDKIAPIAQEKAKGRTKWSLPSVCIAQACCESAYGTSAKMIKANALFGIKVGRSKVKFGKAWKGKAYSTRTKECYDDKTYMDIVDVFRAYDSVSDAVEDYYDMLAACSRYNRCLNQPDAKACITAIKNGGYATSPTYINTIMTIINRYDLTKYDTVITGVPAVPAARQTLRLGDKGEDVRYLQQKLVSCGYRCGNIDGVFGQKTLEAVKALQADRNLSVDGIVSTKTWNVLND